jgi:hypothetical protein
VTDLKTAIEAVRRVAENMPFEHVVSESTPVDDLVHALTTMKQVQGELDERARLLASGPVYVVTEDGSGRDGTFTLSDLPDVPGWDTDSGYPGYGMDRAVAESYAEAINTHRRCEASRVDDGTGVARGPTDAPPMTVKQVADYFGKFPEVDHDRLVVLRLIDECDNYECTLLTPELYSTDKDGYDVEGRDSRVVRVDVPTREP